MSKPWPDEVRSVADALMRECADPTVVAGSNGTSWVVYARGGSAEYDATVMLWRRGGTLITKAEALELLKRSSEIDARYALRDRIFAAVPTASVAIVSDGIEVRVGGKSVRWKREQRERWGRDSDDLFRSDDEVVEHAKQMAAEQAHAAKGATTMTTLDQAKVDASEAALRTAAKQLAKAARDPLAGAVARHLAPGDDGMRAKVAAMLETEAGLALLKALLSLALGAIPQAGTRGAALAHELRVQAMADGADLALDLVMGPLREVVALYLQDAGGVAAPALDAPQSDPTAVDWSTTREVAR